MRIVEKILEVLSIIILTILCLVVLTQITSRAFNNPLMWTEELSRHALVGLTFLGAAYAFYKGKGLKLTVFVDKMPPKIRKINNIAVEILTLFTLVFVMYYGFQFALEMWNSPTASMRLSKGMLILILPISFSLISIKVIANMKNHFQKVYE